MHPPDLQPRPSDRDNTLLVVLIALVSLPVAGLFWVWYRRARFDLGMAVGNTLKQSNDDPLVLLALFYFCLFQLTGIFWIWRDGGRRGVGIPGRLVWSVVVLVLGPLGLWMYLASRPAAPRPPVRQEG